MEHGSENTPQLRDERCDDRALIFVPVIVGIVRTVFRDGREVTHNMGEGAQVEEREVRTRSMCRLARCRPGLCRRLRQRVACKPSERLG